MFTGIVEELGEVVRVRRAADDAARVTVHGPLVTADVAHGASIAVDGVCLTVVESGGTTFTAELMAETLARTTAGHWVPGSPVNLERSVTPATRLGGHLVQGHVDGVGGVIARTERPGYDEVSIAVPRALARYLAPKGAVAVDGISLTVIDVVDGPADAPAHVPADGIGDGSTISLGIIPETRRATTLGHRVVGDRVNIEVDVMAKYAERLLSYREVMA